MTDPATTRALQALRGGATRNAAAGYAGVHRVTFARWMNEDATFRIEVEKAEDEAEAAITAVVQSAMPEHWQAAAWWLERRKWQDYGRKERVEVTFDAATEAKRLAADLGLDESSVLAEAEALVGSGR